MSAEGINSSTGDQYGQYGPFGDWGDHVGRCSIIALAGLSESIPDTANVDKGLVVLGSRDFDIFEALADLESGIRFIQPHPTVNHAGVQALHRMFRHFHTALPLSEAERYWLFDPVVQSERPSTVDVYQPETLVGVAEEVTSAGVKQVIHGREIVRRLAAWRRQMDEYAGQGTLDEAREALGTIATTLVIDANWPREHLDLRAILAQ